MAVGHDSPQKKLTPNPLVVEGELFPSSHSAILLDINTEVMDVPISSGDQDNLREDNTIAYLYNLQETGT